MQYRPTAEEIAERVGEFLEEQVVPTVQPELRHNVRVAANLLRIVGRELNDRGQSLVRERERWGGLLGQPDADLVTLRHDLNRRLLDPEPLEASMARAIYAALLQTAREDLAICKPGYGDWTSETSVYDRRTSEL